MKITIKDLKECSEGFNFKSSIILGYLDYALKSDIKCYVSLDDYNIINKYLDEIVNYELSYLGYLFEDIILNNLCEIKLYLNLLLFNYRETKKKEI